MKNPVITDKGNGKLLLFGEHAAVMGFPAVGLTLPINLETSLELVPRVGDAPFLLSVPRQFECSVRSAVIQAFGLLKVQIPRNKTLRISFHGNVIPDSGLGSSAALCTSLVRALAQFSLQETGAAVLDEETWERAHLVEHIFHGTPSGIDTGLASGNGVYSFTFDGDRSLPLRDSLPWKVVAGQDNTPSMEPERTEEGLWLLYGTVPRAGNTKELVSRIRSNYENKKPETVNAIQTLGDMSREVIELLRSVKRNRRIDLGEIAVTIGALADHAQVYLRALGLSTPLLDSIFDAAKKAGAMGAKLSGAGGGGAFYLVARDLELAADIQKAVKDAVRDVVLFEPVRLTEQF